jgi:DNA-binding MarR family transcriptional regulator
VADWSFLTTHARVMLFLAEHPDARLRDVASGLGMTERTAYGIVADLSETGYVLKERDGRRNRYHIQRHLPLRDEIGRERSVGELLDLLGARRPRRTARPPRSAGTT